MHLNFKINPEFVWFTSDTHYSHTNICKGVSKWDPKKGGTRDFNTLDEMNNVIVNTLNKYVKKDDILIHLGDWSFGGVDKIFEFSDQIICDNIYLNYGNHDHNIENNKEYNYKGDNIRPKELFTACSDVFHITIGSISIFTSHYAHLVWDRSHHGKIHLFGHSHSTINEHCVGKSIDVGIDNAYKMYGEYRPFNLKNDILPIMHKKQIAIFDHHNSETTR